MDPNGVSIYGAEVRALAERAGMPADTLSNVLNGRAQTVEFDIADRLICKMGIPMLWQEDPVLRHAYWRGKEPVDLLAQLVCAAPDCDTHFSIFGGFGSSGAHRRMYCSEACAVRTSRARRGVHRLRDIECRNGHSRATTEQYTDPKTGRTSCMECRRAAMKRHNDARPRKTNIRRRRRVAVTA